MRTPCVSKTLVLLTLQLAFAFPLRADATEYEWIDYSIVQSINCIALDKDTAWIATDAGLVQMNRTSGQFTLFNKCNSKLKILSISSIAIDNKHTKWLATQQGIIRFDGTTWTLFDTTNSALNSNIISQIIVDSADTVWAVASPQGNWVGSTVKYTGGGLFKYEGSGWKRIDSTETLLQSNRINSTVAGLNDIYIAASTGISRRDSLGKWTLFDNTNSPLPSLNLSSMQIDIDGTMWVMCTKSLVQTPGLQMDSMFLVGRMPSGTWKKTYLNDSLPSGMVDAGSLGPCYLKIDHKGRKWFFKDQVGIVIADKLPWSVYYYLNCNLPRDIMFGALTFDEQSNLLYGTRYCDTLKIFSSGQSTNSYAICPSALPFKGFCSMGTDKQGNVWLGSYYGVLKCKNGTFTRYDTANSGLVYNYRNKVAIDSMNRKWFGSNCGGMSMYDDLAWTQFKQSSSGLPDNCVNDIVVDPANNLWFAFYSGVGKYDGKEWAYYPIGHTSSIGLDNKGKIWAGNLHNGGPRLFDGTTWKLVAPDSQGLSMWGMKVAPDGTVWCSTDMGVYRYYLNVWSLYDTATIGNPSRMDPLFVDKENNAWVETSRGVAFFNGQSWQMFSTDNSPLSSNANPLGETPDGSIWFSTPTGLIIRKIKNPTPTIVSKKVTYESDPYIQKIHVGNGTCFIPSAYSSGTVQVFNLQGKQLPVTIVRKEKLLMLTLPQKAAKGTYIVRAVLKRGI